MKPDKVTRGVLAKLALVLAHHSWVQARAVMHAYHRREGSWPEGRERAELTKFRGAWVSFAEVVGAHRATALCSTLNASVEVYWR